MKRKDFSSLLEVRRRELKFFLSIFSLGEKMKSGEKKSSQKKTRKASKKERTRGI